MLHDVSVRNIRKFHENAGQLVLEQLRGAVEELLDQVAVHPVAAVGRRRSTGKWASRGDAAGGRVEQRQVLERDGLRVADAQSDPSGAPAPTDPPRSCSAGSERPCSRDWAAVGFGIRIAVDVGVHERCARGTTLLASWRRCTARARPGAARCPASRRSSTHVDDAAVGAVGPRADHAAVDRRQVAGLERDQHLTGSPLRHA